MTTSAQPLAASSGSSSASIKTASDPTTRPRSKHSHSHSHSNVSKRRVPRAGPSEFLTDRATSQLIRRVLCPQQAGDRGRTTPPPIDELLPPLTSRNDVDLQLYAIISIVLRDFVQTWYHKITPDETFVAEVVQIIAHCTRALEQRLRKVDVEGLLFDELPDLLDKHVQAYRVSRKPVVQPPLEFDPREIYHSLCPLPYLSPIPKPDNPGATGEQAENEVAYRQLLVQGVLAVLLPTEDLENECLTSLVGQILSELIIGGVVVKKASEPWMIWTSLNLLADLMGRKRKDSRGLNAKGRGGSAKNAKGFSLSGLFWSFLHYIFALATLFRAFAMTAVSSRSLPPRSHPMPMMKDESAYHEPTESIRASHVSPAADPVKTPILAFGIWPTISHLIRMDRRMPWLGGSLSMAQWLAIAGPGSIAGFNGVLDRLLSDLIHRHILDPAILPTALRNLRGAVFPNNAMGAQTLFPPESDEELRALRRKCASALWALVPRGVGRLYFGGSGSSSLAAWFSKHGSSVSPGPPRSGPVGDNVNGRPGDDPGGDVDGRIVAEIETDILDVFSDPYCNKHLVYSALELVLIRLMPELAEKGVVELWEERLS